MSFKVSFFLIVSLLVKLSLSAQSLNDYQYIIIPEQFSFQSSPNEYDVNEMLQFSFNKYNFKAFIKGQPLPDEASFCDALQVSVLKKGLLKTVLKLELKDCKGNVVYTSPEGKSLKKDYKVAYFQAIRDIFEHSSLRGHRYKKINTPVAEVKPKQELVAKNVTKTPVKTLLFELRGKQYSFKPEGRNFVITENNQHIGKAELLSDDINYKVNAGSLTGKGNFDDYGNFELIRLNPINNKKIKDILARVN